MQQFWKINDKGHETHRKIGGSNNQAIYESILKLEYIALPLQAGRNYKDWQPLLLIGKQRQGYYDAWPVRRWIASAVVGMQSDANC